MNVFNYHDCSPRPSGEDTHWKDHDFRREGKHWMRIPCAGLHSKPAWLGTSSYNTTRESNFVQEVQLSSKTVYTPSLTLAIFKCSLFDFLRIVTTSSSFLSEVYFSIKMDACTSRYMFLFLSKVYFSLYSSKC